jgi:hypothetical protein
MTTTVVLVVNCFSVMHCTGVQMHVWNWLNGWNQGCSINAIDELAPNAMPIVFLFKIIAVRDEDLELISARAKIVRGHNAKGMVVLCRQH